VETAPARIRRAEGDDLGAVCDLRLEFLGEVRSVDATTLERALRAPTAAFVSEAHRDGTLHSWLALDDHGPVGVVSLLLSPAPPLPEDLRTRDGLVINMYVRPRARRRGVGDELLQACTRGARELGVRRLALYATAAGRPLYERAGFRADADWLELWLD